jgi:PAS domain S-box-containing protein
MDIILRGSAQDGIAIATILREEFQIPVIYITAHTDEATLKRATMSEPFGYLVKPFDEKDLRVVIETALYKHQMERKLAKQEDFLATILKSTSDAVIATDRAAAITYMNAAAESLTGWSQIESLGRDITEIVKLIDENNGAEVANPVPIVLQTGDVAYLQEYTALIDRHGIKKPVGDSASPIRKLAHTIDGAVLVLWDISDRRKAESLQTEKSEVSRALKSEKEISDLKSQFIAMSSHEIRTFLTNIMLATDLLEEPSYPNEKKLVRLKQIKNSVGQMTNLVENMLTLGKLALGLSNFRPILVDLSKFCLEIVEEIKYFPTAKQHESLIINFSSHGENIPAYIDTDLVRYILRNLLSNAIKYSQEEVNIQFRLIYERGSKPKAIFQIEDRGIGIPEADLPNLFNLYYRGSNVSYIKGTGLGLAIVKYAVDIHGGEIAVESEVNQGTIFTVTLPISY